MSADSLYDNIRSYLKLTTRVVSKVGSNINVGERFTLRFTGSNSAYAANIVQQPRIVFNNARVYVQGTEYARPVGGPGWHNLPDSVLYPGEASSVDIEFEATGDLGWWADIWSSEHVAKSWIFADLDQDQFFTIRNYQDVYQEIEET
ncbi:MAG TPA: hypothetical protein ENJ04_11070 [Nitrospirae bacterium]|nr:hypothetical protein [Nitrospirota bacterium]